VIELLLTIISEYEGEFIQLAANILNSMCANDEISRAVRSQRGNVILVNQLKKSKDLPTTLYISRLIMTLCMETDNIKEFRALGLVGLLIRVIEKSQDPLEVINALKILIDMTLDDDTSFYIRQHGAFAILSLIVQYHPSQFPEDFSEEIKPGLYEIQLNALQCIRFLYSIERNRKYFRKVFSPQIFASFIDIGNYIKEISAYQPTLKLLNSLSQRETEMLKEGFLLLKDSNENLPTREIAGYSVGSVLGKGAFGTVYEASKGQNRYALKEIQLTELEGNMDDESPEQVLEMMNKEVSIYKSLDHPNIIKYYTSFVDNESLYIVMELIDGQTLADYISSLKEKNQRIDEGKIWRFAIEMCAGLHYLHIEKKVVHRDFTPMNLMITKDNHVKIADFGLAKQRGTQSSSSMKTFVGTIQYSCPEIVRNQPYTEKADIWSLGVVLYELATLNPPFTGENPLAIARKIVEEDYERLKSQEFSGLFISFVQACMTVLPEKRLGIVGASQMIAPLLMKKIEDYRRKEEEILKINRKEPQEPVKVQIKPGNVKKISDPTVPLFNTLHKLIFLSQIPPGLKKDPRRSMVEGFKHWLFSDRKNADKLKVELVKLNNCEKEEAPMTRGEKVSYETLNFAMEEMLIELGYYDNRTPMTSEMFFQSK
jgi:NIMA (never in mitosis gene a)-related kinase